MVTRGRVRRPRDYLRAGAVGAFHDPEGGDIPAAIVMDHMALTASQARRLAAWLTKAADWISAERDKEGRRARR